jgi:signal transduction histidine kinase
VVQWMLRPLEVAGEAMERVADGDLEHRAPTGADAAGRMGATFNRMADRVQGLVQGQRDLMAAVSHELRTPLTRMRLQTEMLRDSGADPKRVAALEADIRVVDGLVEELLESARLDQGVLALRLERFSGQHLVLEALGEVDLGDRDVTLAAGSSVDIYADRRRVLRVLTNLLSNVQRYTPDDTQVVIQLEAVAGEVTLRVADRGPGVAPASVDRLFDPFFREENSRSLRTGGLGLGLMLCRQIAEAHGGLITATNRQNGGLEVVMRLPGAPGLQAPESA